MTLKIQGQGHGWGQSSKSQCESNILSTHIPLVPCQSALPFLRCSIFRIWPWKYKVKVIAQGHKVCITPYRLTSLSFHVDRPCHSWDTAISKFDVENSRSRSWVRSKLKVITWVQHSVDSHPFHSMSIGHPIPELWLFQNLTLKIKGQGHGWGHNSKSQCGSNILSTHIRFVPCQSGIPFLSYDFFKIWPWRSKVKVMGEVTVQSQNVGLTSYRLISLWFHVNRPSHSWDPAFSKFDLEDQGSRSNDWCFTTTGLDSSIELRMVQIHLAVSKIWVPQSLAKVLPDFTSFWPMGEPIWGKWANNYDVAQLQV